MGKKNSSLQKNNLFNYFSKTQNIKNEDDSNEVVILEEVKSTSHSKSSCKLVKTAAIVSASSSIQIKEDNIKVLDCSKQLDLKSEGRGRKMDATESNNIRENIRVKSASELFSHVEPHLTDSFNHREFLEVEVKEDNKYNDSQRLNCSISKESSPDKNMVKPKFYPLEQIASEDSIGTIHQENEYFVDDVYSPPCISKGARFIFKEPYFSMDRSQTQAGSITPQKICPKLWDSMTEIKADQQKYENSPVKQLATSPHSKKTEQQRTPFATNVTPNKSKALTTPRKNPVSLQCSLTDVKTSKIKSVYSPVKHLATPPRSKKNIFSNKGNPVVLKRRYEIPYYLLNFTTLINFVTIDSFYKDLFDEMDRECYDIFNKCSLEAQIVYVRLFNRKNEWKRQDNIRYKEEVGDSDLPEILKELVSTGLLDDGSSLIDLREALLLLQAHELKEINKDLKIKVGRKEEVIHGIVQHCQTVKRNPLLGSKTVISLETKVVERCRRIVAPCYRISSSFRNVFRRMLSLAMMHKLNLEDEERGKSFFLLGMLQTMVGKMKYPDYNINRQTRIFRTRDDLIRYSDALKQCEMLREAMDSKKYEDAVTIAHISLDIFKKDLENIERMAYEATIPLHLRRYVSTSLHAYAVWKMAEAFEKQRKYSEAVEVMEILVAQDVYIPYYKGKIFDRLALDYGTHLKNLDKLKEIIDVACNSRWVSESHKFSLKNRLFRFTKKQDTSVEVISDPTQLRLTKQIELQGRRLESETGGKSTFIRWNENGERTFSSVEEFAIQHFKENGFSEGIHSEGSLFTSLFGLSFWDILYGLDIPDAFIGIQQEAPLDLDSSFYENRKTFVDERLRNIREWTEEGVRNSFNAVWEKNCDVISLVNWSLLGSVDNCVGLVLSIGLPGFVGICERLAKNYRVWRSGFPDLTVWNPETRDHCIVEVKGPSDRLSPKQILWLEYLNEVGCKAVVCWVEDIGNSKRKRVQDDEEVVEIPKKRSKRDVIGTSSNNTELDSTKIKQNKRKRKTIGSLKKLKGKKLHETTAKTSETGNGETFDSDASDFKVDSNKNEQKMRKEKNTRYPDKVQSEKSEEASLENSSKFDLDESNVDQTHNMLCELQLRNKRRKNNRLSDKPESDPRCSHDHDNKFPSFEGNKGIGSSATGNGDTASRRRSLRSRKLETNN